MSYHFKRLEGVCDKTILFPQGKLNPFNIVKLLRLVACSCIENGNVSSVFFRDISSWCYQLFTLLPS